MRSMFGQVLAAVVVTTTCCSQVRGGDVILYVDDDAPPGDSGLSWDAPYRFLQDALEFAANWENGVTEIHVAGGVYKPDQDSSSPQGDGDPDRRFELTYISLRGGYAGYGAPNPEIRDLSAYETILGGDLAGDDAENFANYDDNSRSIILGSGLLDGLTIRSAYYNGATVAQDEQMSVYSCTFALNRERGLQVGGWDNSAFVHDCLFEHNGGAISVGGYVNATNCQFINNEGAENGAAIFAYDAGVYAEDCDFTGNVASRYGGAVYCGEYAGVHLEHCRFTDNSALRGGAIYNNRLTGSYIDSCEFRHNTGSERGGAISSAGYSSMNRNGVYAINSVFFHNVTGGNGGALHNVHTNAKLVNCTLAGNEAALGGGVLTGSTSDLIVYNSIIRANFGGAFGGVGARHVHYSNISGGHAGLGNIDKPAKFVDFANGDLHLRSGAKSIDAGRKPLLPLDVSTDLDGNPRFVDDRNRPNTGTGNPPVDMGAYEFQP